MKRKTINKINFDLQYVQEINVSQKCFYKLPTEDLTLNETTFNFRVYYSSHTI